MNPRGDGRLTNVGCNAEADGSESFSGLASDPKSVLSGWPPNDSTGPPPAVPVIGRVPVAGVLKWPTQPTPTMNFTTFLAAVTAAQP